MSRLANARAHCNAAMVLPTPGRPPTNTSSWAWKPPPSTSSSGWNPVGNRAERASRCGPWIAAVSTMLAVCASTGRRDVAEFRVMVSSEDLRSADGRGSGDDDEQRGQDANDNGEHELDGHLHRAFLGSLLALSRSSFACTRSTCAIGMPYRSA